MKTPVPHRFASFLLAATLLLAALPALAAGPLIFSCAADNDLFRVASDNGVVLKRCDTPEAAVAAAGEGDGVLLLAGAYPQQTTAVAPEVFAQAARKHLRLYVEYPATLPDTKIDAPRKVKLERAVVASNTFGPALARMRLLIIHGCHFLPMEAKSPHLVLARVAGYDTAVFGLPETEVYPVLFEHPRGDILVATTKLSQFVTGRYAPNDAWPEVWRMVFTWLAPGVAVPALKWTPTVRPRYDRDATLPATAATEAIVRGVDWSTKTRMLVHPSWKDRPQPPAPDASWPCGDGELGLLEGMRSEVDYLGRQPVIYNLRSDCIGESALAFALRAGIENDTRSTRIASNLLDWLYDRSGLFIDTPEKPSYGMLAWTPDAAGALYQDNDVRVMLGCMGTAAILGTDRWDEKLLINILANFRTTGRLGFRGERLEHPDLLKRGWRSFWDAPLIRLSPHFEAWTWAAYLWLYDKTHFAPLLERTKLGINLMMEKYPGGWFWTNGIQQERARMLLVLAWLVRVEDTPQHRAWLDRIATDMGAAQDECGAIREELGDVAMGYFPPPESNAKYGTNEAPLIHANGDPVADLLYTCNFAFLGLHEAAAVTGDVRYQRMEDKLADFLLRIQVHSETHPELDGAWFRAFDFKRWEYFGSNADAGWGAWCVESGWTQGWIPTVLDLRRRGVSLWDLTAHSTIARHMDKIRPAMLPDEAVAATPEILRVRHAAVGRNVLSMTKPDPRFNLGGTAGLVDGELLTADWAAKWLAYIQRDFEAVIDLGSVIPIQQLGITCMQQVFHGMYLPTEVEFAVSTDNLTFIPAGTAKPDVAPTVAGPLTKALLTSTPEATRGRYLRVHAHNRAVIPAGLEGAGNQAWLMVDEILVNPVGLPE
jgi:hypothetical protein